MCQEGVFNFVFPVFVVQDNEGKVAGQELDNIGVAFSLYTDADLADTYIEAGNEDEGLVKISIPNMLELLHYAQGLLHGEGQFTHVAIDPSPGKYPLIFTLPDFVQSIQNAE